MDDDPADQSEPLPTELDPATRGHYLEVQKDKLSMRYTGAGQHQNDVGSIQANGTVPKRRLVYYFECLIRNGGDRCCIGVGFAPADFKIGRQPGWVAPTSLTTPALQLLSFHDAFPAACMRHSYVAYVTAYVTAVRTSALLLCCTALLRYACHPPAACMV